MLVGCTPVPAVHARDRTGIAWHNVHAQPALQFAFVWNAQFRSHEILWRNRGPRALQFRFAADSLATATRERVRERVLAAGFTETMPGEAIVPGRETGMVCVHLAARG